MKMADGVAASAVIRFSTWAEIHVGLVGLVVFRSYNKNTLRISIHIQSLRLARLNITKQAFVISIFSIVLTLRNGQINITNTLKVSELYFQILEIETLKNISHVRT